MAAGAQALSGACVSAMQWQHPPLAASPERPQGPVVLGVVVLIGLMVVHQTFPLPPS